MSAPDDPPRPTDEELLARFQRSANRPRGSETLGFQIVAVNQAEMRVEATFEAREEFQNPMRQVQGGFLCAMLDDVMSVAGVVASGMTHVMPTLEMKTSFLRPALPGQKLRCIGRVVKWGRTIAFTEGEIYDEAGKLLAKATGTAMPAPYKKFK
ncbi:MAG: hotdog fold thioesterase [Alphaproteobacteria bacterium]|nr:hotdog fold thioesterase [Alphaproteobacteria bacterium]